MKDCPISKLTITKTGHRPSQFKKISDALPVLYVDKNCRDHNELMGSSVPDVTESKLTLCQLIQTPPGGLSPIMCKSAQ